MPDGLTTLRPSTGRPGAHRGRRRASVGASGDVSRTLQKLAARTVPTPCNFLLGSGPQTGGGVCHLASKENPCTSVRSALLPSRVLPPWPSAPAVGPAPPPRPTPAAPA